jgi:hypothetical protein
MTENEPSILTRTGSTSPLSRIHHPREHRGNTLSLPLLRMDPNYMIYQVERTKTVAEQREADRRAGEIAAAIASLFRSLAKPARLTAPRARTRSASSSAPCHHTSRTQRPAAGPPR